MANTPGYPMSRSRSTHPRIPRPFCCCWFWPYGETNTYTTRHSLPLSNAWGCKRGCKTFSSCLHRTSRQNWILLLFASNVLGFRDHSSYSPGVTRLAGTCIQLSFFIFFISFIYLFDVVRAHRKTTEIVYSRFSRCFSINSRLILKLCNFWVLH